MVTDDERHESLSWAETDGDGQVTVPVRNLVSVERRIREACGEVDDKHAR